jgi:spermidine/putrescine transport system permease protein
MPRNRKVKNPWLALEAISVYVFLYVPIFILILFSFNSSRSMAIWEGFTVKWYLALWKNPMLRDAFINSLLVALAATGVSIVIGTPAALAMHKFDFLGKDAFDNLVHLPIIVPEIVIAVSLLMFFGLIKMNLSLATIILAHVAFCVSYMILVVRARLAGFDRTLEEAALDLGANQIQTFFKVTLPLIKPGIVSGALLVFTISLDDFVVTSFVAGVGSTTLPVQIYSMLKQGITPEINAASSLLLVITIVLVYISQRSEDEKFKV